MTRRLPQPWHARIFHRHIRIESLRYRPTDKCGALFVEQFDKALLFRDQVCQVPKCKNYRWYAASEEIICALVKISARTGALRRSKPRLARRINGSALKRPRRLVHLRAIAYPRTCVPRRSKAEGRARASVAMNDLDSDT